MKRAAPSGPKRMRMTQRVSQKYTMKYVVAGSSILGCMLAALVVINLSRNESTYANEKKAVSPVNYRSVEVHLNERMVLESEEISKRATQEYKGKDSPQSARMVSRAKDVNIRNIEQSISE
ncbi:MAG: hypothetical protein JNL88_12590 [Bacteroidia bacterium]|nr:hypothetical protein [Bacteroidia bacterium]